jgi:hypothetical protein
MPGKFSGALCRHKIGRLGVSVSGGGKVVGIWAVLAAWRSDLVPDDQAGSHQLGSPSLHRAIRHAKTIGNVGHIGAARHAAIRARPKVEQVEQAKGARRRKFA